jgi:hypothetical protein
MALTPAKAEAAVPLTTICNSCIRIKAPKAWKQKLAVSSQGHTSGVVNIEFYWPKATQSRVPLMRYSGMYKAKDAYGKSTITYRGTDRYGVNWTIKRGRISFDVMVRNIPYLIWQCSHGEGDFKFTRRQADQLLKLFTGGKITYTSLIKWSRSKAIKTGGKAVRAWVGRYVIKHSLILS